MTAIAHKSPLHWPNTKDATRPMMRSLNSSYPLNLTLREALAYLEDEVKELAPQAAILYSNIEHLNNERMRRKINPEPGVTLELKVANKNYYIACDRWVSIEQNLYSLHLGIRAIRNLVKWGLADLDVAMHGFAAIKQRIESQDNSDSEAEFEEWMVQLGLGPTATLEDAQAVYRRRAKALADNTDELIKLNNAMDEARKYFTG